MPLELEFPGMKSRNFKGPHWLEGGPWLGNHWLLREVPLKSVIRAFMGTENDCPEGLTLHSLEVTPELVQEVSDCICSNLWFCFLHSLMASELYGDYWFSFKVFVEESKPCHSQQILLNQDLFGLIYLEYKIPLLSCLVISGTKNITTLGISKWAQSDLFSSVPWTYLRSTCRF